MRRRSTGHMLRTVGAVADRALLREQNTRGHRPRLQLGVLIALIVQIPFEFRYTLAGLSNLQWTFLAIVLLWSPELLRRWNQLTRDRLLQAAALFVAIQWLAALYAPEFHTNAFKAAARFTAGLVLVCIARQLDIPRSISLANTWAIASVAAAVYALAAHASA